MSKLENSYDAVLVGAGIMSSTLAVLLSELDPELRLLIVERLEAPGLESSAAINNAGTGHAANCELNYTPLQSDGTIQTAKALEINKAFEISLEFWAALAFEGKLNPDDFLNLVPHISCVWGENDINFLNKRYQKLKSFQAFSDMEWTTDRSELEDWMPLVIKNQDRDKLYAATRVKRGMDVDFGALTSSYLNYLLKKKFLDLKLKTQVNNLEKIDNNYWQLELSNQSTSYAVRTPFVFLGAGGGALSLLQKSGISEANTYGGFPVSGQWLVCSDLNMITSHFAKVYGKAKLGAPPMSVPHLDTRWINGKRSLIFGPFAGFSTKFLKQGSNLDLFKSMRLANIFPMLNVGLNNLDLVKYLLDQLSLNEEERLKYLKNFLPIAYKQDWTLSTAGQRVQIIKKDKRGGVLKMGTEVVASNDGSLAALLGASPGASTAVKIMIEVLERCWPEKMTSDGWQLRLKALLPSFDPQINTSEINFRKMRERTDSLLSLSS